MRDHQAELGDALLVVVTFADAPARLAAYRRHLGLEAADVPLLADTERSVYRLLGAGRGSLRQVWSPGTLAMYVRLVRRGRRLRRPEEDTRQLGADAVVDRSGRLHRVWLPSGPDQRPPVSEIVDAVRELHGQ
ncbi:MAG: AhpC/TSA family protein [Acidimicrobiia bacterium]